jgi:hypothetical protein
MNLPFNKNERKPSYNNEDRVSMRTINSVIFWVFIECLKKSVEPQSNNQAMLSVDLRVKPRTGGIRLDKSLPEPKENEPNKEAPCILKDIFELEDLDALFVSNKKLADGLVSTALEIMENLSRIIDPIRLKLLWGNIMVKFEKAAPAFRVCKKKGWPPYNSSEKIE